MFFFDSNEWSRLTKKKEDLCFLSLHWNISSTYVNCFDIAAIGERLALLGSLDDDDDDDGKVEF